MFVKRSLYHFEDQEKVIQAKYNYWEMIAGNVMAFASGLFFTVNNFIIKGVRLSFGEVLAVRSIIQIPLMSLILFMRGMIMEFHIFLNSGNYKQGFYF